MERSEITKTLARLSGIAGLAVITGGCEIPMTGTDSQKPGSIVISKQPSGLPRQPEIVKLPIISEKPTSKKSYRIDAVGGSLEINYRRSSEGLGGGIKGIQACFDQRNLENQILLLEREVYGRNYRVSLLTQLSGTGDFSRRVIINTPFGTKDIITRDDGQNSRNCYGLRFNPDGHAITYTDPDNLEWKFLKTP